MPGKVSEKKSELVARVIGYLREYKRIMIVSADHVGSKHMQGIRMMLRPDGVLAMGKNTLLRRAVRTVAKEDNRPDLEALLPYLNKNVGLVFSKMDLSQVKEALDKDTRPAAARAGVISDRDVMVAAGPSGLEPTKTSFLQAVGIASKISKGQIDILNDTVLVRTGERVTASAATLLGMLGILPFEYGLRPLVAYDDGDVFSARVLDLTEDDIIASFNSAIRNVASVSLASNTPTEASVPHSFVNGFKNVLSVCLSVEYTFDAAKELKALLSDPEALARATAAAAGSAATETKEEEKVEEEEEEDADFGGGGLFGDDDDDDW